MLYQLSYIGPQEPKIETRNWKLLHSDFRTSVFEFQASNWSGRRESNPRPTAWKAVTLPLSYSRPAREARGESRNSKFVTRGNRHPIFDFRVSTFGPFWWTGEGSNLRRPQGSADLQSAAFDHSATCPLCFILPSALASAGAVMRLFPRTVFI